MTNRVWDAFLTPGDKATIRERPHQVWGFGQRPALVLIDLYRWVFGDERPSSVNDAIADWPGTCGPQAWDALPHLQRLLAAARAAEMPIVHVTGIADTDNVRTWSRRSKEGRSGAPPLAPTVADRQRRRFDIVDEVAPLPGETVLYKSAPSGFFGTLLTAHLHGLGVDAIILGGESTSGCVRSTVVDGRSYRFDMTVVEECVFDRHAAPHAINLFDMHEKYADVLGVDEVVAHLDDLASTSRVNGRPVVAT
jgi:maleamate amidohydrolase